MSHNTFDNIRPYFDHEVPAAIARMLNNPQFQMAMDYLFPSDNHAEIIDRLMEVDTSYDFQKYFMHRAINRILELSSKGLSLNSVQLLKDNGPSVLLSNHRDILLDSAILQVVLVDLGIETSEITFGDNLMINDFIIDFGKVNRMFTVYRGGSPREILKNSQHLSAYIHYTLKEKKRSAWIAQRKGRTKNGLDKTDVGVLKMLTVFDRKNPIDAFLETNILPIAISYEWEPCDFFKLREVYLSQKQTYVKQAGEDLQSVLEGINQQKGRIHLAVGKPVNKFVREHSADIHTQNIHQQVAAYIDRQVAENYRLYPNNYVAYDLLRAVDSNSEMYTEEDKQAMEIRLGKLYEFMGAKSDEIKNLYLQMYANPLIQRRQLLSNQAQKL
jgi:hypothetical protein